jgi:hypothetical protein
MTWSVADYTFFPFLMSHNSDYLMPFITHVGKKPTYTNILIWYSAFLEEEKGSIIHL